MNTRKLWKVNILFKGRDEAKIVGRGRMENQNQSYCPVWGLKCPPLFPLLIRPVTQPVAVARNSEGNWGCFCCPWVSWVWCWWRATSPEKGIWERDIPLLQENLGWKYDNLASNTCENDDPTGARVSFELVMDQKQTASTRRWPWWGNAAEILQTQSVFSKNYTVIYSNIFLPKTHFAAILCINYHQSFLLDHVI